VRELGISFFVFTFVGVAGAIAHLVLPGEHRLGAAAAAAVGVAGAWAGALIASALVSGGWHSFGGLALAGSVVGAAGSLAVVEALAEAYAHRHPHGPA